MVETAVGEVAEANDAAEIGLVPFRKGGTIAFVGPGHQEREPSSKPEKLSPGVREALDRAKSRCEHPVLVTGLPRSGTTWVGKVLAESPGAIYMHEPFNGDSGWAHFIPTPAKFLYLDPNEPSLYDRCARSLTQLEIWAKEYPTHFERASYDRIVGAAAETDGPVRPILKDPIALLSADWLADRHGCRVAMLLRHPTHVVQSLTRLQWPRTMDFMTDQPRARERFLRVGEFETVQVTKEMNLAERASVLVRTLLLVTRTSIQSHPEWTVVNYEDLVNDPVAGFGAVFDQFGLPRPDALMKQFSDGAAGVHDGSAHQKQLRPIPLQPPARSHESAPDVDFGELWDTHLADVADELAPWAGWKRPT